MMNRLLRTRCKRFWRRRRKMC